jgi:hypothetical protein
MKYCFYQTFKQVIERHAIVANQPLIEALHTGLQPIQLPTLPADTEIMKRWRSGVGMTLCRQLLGKMGLWDEECEKALRRRCEQEIMLKVGKYGRTIVQSYQFTRTITKS